MGLKPQKVKLSLPFNLGSVSFVADAAQQRAAWSLYVELVTRVAIEPLDDEHGLLREALNSLYRVFDITRATLKEVGPEVANGPDSLGPIAIAILNSGLRPFLSKWHPKLLAYEHTRPPNVPQLDYERAWEHFAEMRDALRALQQQLGQYIDSLAQIAGVDTPRLVPSAH